MRKLEKSILFAVTVSISLGFLRGQVGLLGRRGWRTGVVSACAEPGQLESFAAQENASAFAVPLEREISPAADLRALGELYRTLRRFRPTITNVGTPKAGLLGGLAAVAAGVPVRVYTLHGLRLETAAGRKAQVLNVMERLAMACAHRVVCVSPSLQARVHELKLAPAHKTLVLGSGSVRGVPVHPPERTARETEQLRAGLGLPVGTPVIGFVGRLTRDKGISELLEAYRTVSARLPQVRLLLIGDQEDGDPVGTEAQAAIRQEPNIFWTGPVPDVTAYYPLMTLLALPTYREGLGMVALEAAAAGIPVISTTATGARDAVVDGVTGWTVPVGDAAALARACLEALGNPQEARRRGEQGRERVRREFDPEEVQARWLEWYETLIQWRELSRRNPGKRAFDLLAAGTGLATLGLPLLLLSGLIRLRLGSPVLFRQVRPGLNGQPFTMYKFRTMTDGRGPDGALLPDAVRLTPFGKFLRASSLDELPGLINVLRGEMSLVGPRPLLMEYLPLYSAQQARRHEVRPGLTGWAQVNGRNALSWEEKFGLDVWYVENRSFALDLRILLMTVRKVLVRDGISAPGEATMSRFTGSSQG